MNPKFLFIFSITILSSILILSCGDVNNKVKSEKLKLELWDANKVDSVEILEGYPLIILKLDSHKTKEFVIDLISSKEIGITKYKKSHRILLYHNYTIDTVFTTGNIHRFKNVYFKSKINVIDKYQSSFRIAPKKSRMINFIDSMRENSFLLDTIFIHKIWAWQEAANSPKGAENGTIYCKLKFPVEEYAQYFSEPKTYFFAYWNKQDSTFNNGTDYLIMTWKIDSEELKMEKEIIKRLIGFMFNYPCYVFRNNDKLYAVGHRQTVMYKQTLDLTEQLRDFINKESAIYGNHNIENFE